MRDHWVEKYEKEVYDRFPPLGTKSGCRPATNMGVMTCPSEVVREGRCILHAPKLTNTEKRALAHEDADRERKFEDSFRVSLLQQIQAHLKENPGSGRFAAIQFPEMPWNQPPWIDILRSNHVNFSMAVFHQGANFSAVGFGQKPRFIKAVFRDNVTFGTTAFHKGVEFVEAVFERDVSFSGTQFGGWSNLAQCRFEGNVDFSWAKVGDRIWFQGSDDNPVFSGEARFHRLNLEPEADVFFESVNLAQASLLHTNVESMRFANVTWNQPESKIASRSSRRKMLWDERRLSSGESAATTFEAVADNYRQLVLTYERKRDFDSAEDFHIGEMEVRRLGVAACVPRAFRPIAKYLNVFALYRYLSAYGSSYWQALAVLLMILFFTAAIFMFTGLRPVQAEPGGRNRIMQYGVSLRQGQYRPSFTQVWADYVDAVTHTLSVLTFRRERAYRPASTLSQAFEALATVVLTGQSALLLLAIRRRFRR